MKIDTPTLSNAPAVYDRQTFDMMLGSLRSYFNRLKTAVNYVAAGGDGEVQFANAGALDSSANVTISLTTGALTLGVDATINGCVAGQGAGADASNTVFGVDALGTSNTGINNTVFGWSNLIVNTTGENNTVLGNGCLIANETGTSNIAVGFALETNVSGSDNIGIGWSALASSTGNNNVAIGSSAGSDAVFNATTESNRIVMGNNSHTNAYIKVAWTVTSDARDKIVHGCVPHGLDFVDGLYPVKYQFRTARGENTVTGRVKYGFLAQEIRALEDVGVVIDDEDPDNLKYNESSLVPILVNAIKELKTRVEALEVQNESGKNPGGA